MFVTIITFAIILSLLVFVHELGHFWVAKKLGVRAEEFGFGFPPRAFGVQILRGKKLKKIKESENIDITVTDIKNEGETEIIKETIIDTKQEIDELVEYKKWKFIRGGEDPKYLPDEKDMDKSTIYSINWVPLGGFVKIKGEDGGSEKDQDSFSVKKIWQRCAILLAGVTMNIVLAAFLISIGFMVGLPQALDNKMTGAKISNRQVQVVEIIKGSQAEKAELKIGDIIMSVNNKEFNGIDELQMYVAGQVGKKLDYKIKRGNELITKQITPEKLLDTGQGGIGIAIVESGLVRYNFFMAIWQGAKTTVLLTWAIIVAFYELLRNLIMGHGAGADLAGPIGIAVLTGQVAHLGLVYILQFAAMLSINLAIINAFPFPALDGGRILFLIIEKIKGSPVKKEVEGIIHNIGFALLMILVVFVTFKDVARYSDKFINIWQKIIG
jgi:regulator of sigma E protease